MNARKQYNSLDLAKFIAAILIVIIHANPFTTYSGLLSYSFRNIIAVVAVPFFFVTSGFLFFTKLNTLGKDEQKQYFGKYIKRLCIMYLLWSAVYFVFVLTEWIVHGFKAVDILIYIRDFFFKGSYSTIWFLPALITAVAIVYLLHKKFAYKTIFLISVPFYVFACLGSSYYGLVDNLPIIGNLFDAYFYIFDTVKNGVLFGWLYVALGGYLSEKIEKKPINTKYSFVLSVVFFIFMAAETIGQKYFKLSTNGVDTKILLVPLSIFLFYFIISINIKSNGMYVWMRKLSLLMFLSQRIFLTLFDWFLSNTFFVKNSLVYFTSVLILTLAFSVLFIKLSDKVKVLKQFY